MEAVQQCYRGVAAVTKEYSGVTRGVTAVTKQCGRSGTGAL